MSVLEQILRDIEDYEDAYDDIGTLTLCPAWVEEIIMKHLPAEDMNVPTNDGWTLMEEQPPKDEGFYLVSIDLPQIDDDYLKVTKAWFSNGNKTFMDFGKTVIAWRPLPKPYKPEKERKPEVTGTEFFHKRFMEVK